MWQKIVSLLNQSNQSGIPIPMLKDPKSGQGSVTLTMFWLAFNISALALVGKITNYLGGINYNDTLWLLGICGSFYLGRQLQVSASGVASDAAPQNTSTTTTTSSSTTSSGA